MLIFSGMLALPKDPQLKWTESTKGDASFVDFLVVSQGLGKTNNPEWQQWECNMFVPADRMEFWKARLQPRNVLYVEYGQAISYPILDGKYHKTRLKLDQHRTKLLEVPLWASNK